MIVKIVRNKPKTRYAAAWVYEPKHFELTPEVDEDCPDIVAAIVFDTYGDDGYREDVDLIWGDTVIVFNEAGHVVDRIRIPQDLPEERGKL